MSSNYPAKPRHVIISADDNSSTQAAVNCWDSKMPFPDTAEKLGHQREDNLWEPYLNSMGLTRDNFKVQFQVQGKRSPPECPTRNRLPTWPFLAWTLIALSPKGKLASREIYHLSLAWCSGLAAKNQSMRKALAFSSKPGEILHLIRGEKCYVLQDLNAGNVPALPVSVVSAPSLQAPEGPQDNPAPQPYPTPQNTPTRQASSKRKAVDENSAGVPQSERKKKKRSETPDIQSDTAQSTSFPAEALRNETERRAEVLRQLRTCLILESVYADHFRTGEKIPKEYSLPGKNPRNVLESVRADLHFLRMGRLPNE